MKEEEDIPQKMRVFLVDDHPIVRQGLTRLVNQEQDLTVCGEAEDAGSALERLRSARPDILILDISLKDSDGIELLKDLRKMHCDLPILILSMHDETFYAERSLRAGAKGYIMKQEATDLVLTAIRQILNGEVYVSERIAQKMISQYATGTEPSKPSSIESLSNRELEIFRLVGQGLRVREIAEKLQLSVKTVETYCVQIKDKLGLKTGREMVRYAIEWSRRYLP
jgi:DNA-binding NarL/FixJ family response regulator